VADLELRLTQAHSAFWIIICKKPAVHRTGLSVSSYYLECFYLILVAFVCTQSCLRTHTTHHYLLWTGEHAASSLNDRSQSSADGVTPNMSEMPRFPVANTSSRYAGTFRFTRTHV